MKRDRVIARLVDWVFGFDFFLSYSHGDGLRLPGRLKRRLEQAGFRVFLDQTEYVAGIDLRRETRRQVRKSRKVVVVGRAGALKSPWVKREVDVALAAGKTPIIIDVNGAVESAPDDATLAVIAREQHWLRLNELLDDPDGEPSERTVSELVRGFNYTRQETKRQRFFATAAAVLAIATGAAIWQAWEANRARVVAEAQRDRAQRVLDQVVATSNRRVHALSARMQQARAAGNDPVVSTDDTGPAEPLSGSPLEQANSLIARGSAHLDRGDFEGARPSLKAALSILGSGSQAVQAKSDWRLAFFAAYDRLAEAERRSGDGEEGLIALTKALAIAEEESAAEAATLEWQQRLALTHERIGALLLERDALADAESHYREAIALLRKLEGEPLLLPRARRELADALTGLGDLQLARKQPEAGLLLYKESLSFLEQLTTTDPEDPDLQRDMSVVLQSIVDASILRDKLGDASDPAERLNEALRWADRDLAVSQRLSSAAASDPRAQRDLASSYDRRAYFLERLDRSAEALQDYGRGIALLDPVSAREDALPEWKRDDAAMLEKMGKLLVEAEPERAIAAFRHALSIREGLAASLEEPAWQLEVEAAYRRTSESMLRMGREAEALETAEQYLLSTSFAPDNDSNKVKRIARALGTLCWSAVNARNFSRALWAGREAVQLDPELGWIRLNYAHALMFSGEREQARTIYLQGPDMNSKAGAEWKEGIRADFDILRERGLSDDLMVEISSRLGI